ncbi:trimeric intracellular cation channel family protein [Nguyenibacter sp. L1]|uniref:trimeric intracellular cation channel family protein n=1 Tax=Nguyenibacter sp. L1 TaxID=3049350 RepID=UPI002B49904B|nr:trimeric intracellular cation channel family protein [Nguyenibacter sp. L1]WRH88641.1 trimeric intracellular cation channel family protein [Nguyenibacter sp. L1]
MRMDRIVLAGDLAGTMVFAAEGAMAAIGRGLDVFGVVVVACVVALGGCIIRDVLIGDTPPSAIRDWRYPALACLTGLALFAARHALRPVPAWYPLAVLDAAGLSLFAVTGAEKALSRGLVPLGAALLGMVTAIGGGVMRDILVNRVPMVLVSDIYATAALAGALVVVAGRRLALPGRPVACAGAATCFGLRLLALHYGWHLPGATPPS